MEAAKLNDIPQTNFSNEQKSLPSHAHLYKTAGTKMTQNERRKNMLKALKDRRNASMDEKRGISDIFSEALVEEVEEEGEPMDVEAYNKKKKRRYGSKLMMSEYFIEKPEDLEQNWLFKLCPVGVRNLVVAHNRTTKSYNKAGVLQAEFESLLPGGAPNAGGSKFTVLDCIFSQTTQTYYVLDILAWNSFSLISCSTEFRFFFLKSKLEENPDVSKKSKRNRFPFYEVIGRPAHLSSVEDVLSYPIDYEREEEKLDGILFYHSEVDYRACATPLVGWLKIYMVPEILGIPVAACYMNERPENYVNLRVHMERAKVHYLKKYGKADRERKLKDVEMTEVQPVVQMD